MISLRRLVLPSTESYKCNFAQKMRNVSFLQSYPKRAFANRTIHFAEQFDKGKVICIAFKALKCQPTKIIYQKK